MQARRPERLAVVLVGTEGEVNLGFVARLVANFGADELILVSPQVNPLSDEALRYAAKATDVLRNAKIADSLEEVLKDYELSACTSARVGYKTDVLRHPITPREFAELSTRYRSVAVVFGRESVGLTREEIAKCDILVTIPANPEYPVLNLSHAVAIILYELWLTRSRFKGFHEPADAETLRRVEKMAEEIARRVVDEQRLVHVIAAIKHCLSRSALTRGEASTLYYFFKRVFHSLVRGEGGDEATINH